MIKLLRFFILFTLVFSQSMRLAYAQSSFASEEELKKQAAKLFEEEEFEEAYPLFTQLASLYPKDVNYTYKLGVCMLYVGEDKEKPIGFLEFATKKSDVEKEAFFYLAKAYHLNYRFDDAIAQYVNYLKMASETKAEKLLVDRQIQMCKNGKKLLRNITDLQVIERKEVSKTDFYRSYDISGIGGKLLSKPDEEVFKTATDRKKKEKSIIYLATNNNAVFYSSYGENTENGKDIYIVRKLPNGEWSKPQTLGYPVNTEYDEDFPFLHPNGKVLYFCSKGHNSMGGYDIFKTTLNEETNTWNKPVNLDFPINTPDDDILYVTNEDEKEAYFSSARNSKPGMTDVYHINVERKPIDVAIVKGMVVKTKDDQALDVKITVKDLGDNTILGIYNAKPTGGYLINLPNGGRFMYTVEATGFATQSEVVVLPTQYEFKPLKQEISYETGTDKLIVKNLFDEPVDDQSYLLALNFIKEKSKMEAGIPEYKKSNTPDNNTTPEDNSSTATNTTTEPVKNNSAPTNLTNADIVKIAFDDAKEAEKEAKDLQEQADIALNMANQKNDLAQNKSKEATQLMADANSMTDNVKKQTAIDEANAARAESEDLNQETVAAFNIAKKLAVKASAKDEEADLSMQYAKDLEAAVKSKNPTEALAKLAEQEKKLEELSEKNGAAEPDNIFSGLKVDAEAKKRELDKATQASADIKQEIADNETLIGTLESDKEKARKDDLKKGIQDQIDGLKADIEQSKKDLELSDLKVAKIQKDYNGIKNEMDLVSSVAAKAKTETNENAAASVASIDKTRLEQQVNELKTSSESYVPPVKTNTEPVVVATNTTENKSTTENKTTTEPVATNTTENKTTTEPVATNTTENKTTTEPVATNTTENKTTTEPVATNTTENKTTTEPVATNTTESTNTESTPTNYKQQFADQMATVGNEAETIERENKKAAIYKDWVAAINNELAQKKADLKSEKDKSKKKELNKQIADLEADLKTKQSEEQTVLANVEKLKTEQPVVAENTSTENKTPDNTTSTETSTASSSVPAIAGINAKYTDQLAEADKIANEADKEKAKSDILNDWAKAIDANIDQQKQALASATDPEMKALLTKKISDAESLSEEKKTQADVSLAKSTSLKQTASTASTETTNTNTPSNTSSTPSNTASVVAPADKQKLESAIKEADGIANELDRETKKKEAYTNYIAEANAELKAKNESLKNENDENKKKELIAAVDVIESNIKTKQAELNASNAKITQLKNPMLTINSSQSAVSDANIEAQSKKAKEAEKDAAKMEQEAADLRELAGEATNTKTRDSLFAAAGDRSKQAEQKKAEATKLTSDANIAEYNANVDVIDQMAAASAGNSSDEVAMAEMMKDESKIYIAKAQKSRELANSAVSEYDKNTAMEDAVVNEKIALDKQRKAAALYKKNNPGFVAKSTTVPVHTNTTTATSTENKTTPPVATNTTENKTTTEPVATNTTENKTTTEPVATNSTENKTTTEPVATNTTENKTTTEPVATNSTENKTTTEPVATNTTENKTTTEPVATNTTENKTTTEPVATNTTENKTTTEPVATNTTENKTTTEPTTTNTTISVTSNVTETFVKSSAPVYSSTKPIPVNEKLPEGLIFKVQIGAFRNPISPDAFSGMSPLTAETTPSGLTRYTAGIFIKYATADKVKEEIRQLGYKDAFVVAFLNGKRISLIEASTLAGEQIPNVNGNAATPSNTTAAVATNTNTPENTNANTPSNTTAASTEIAPATSITVAGGLFYTVQVGVYAQPVSSGRLYGIQPLYTSKAPNGYLRYNTGVYNNAARASEARAIVVGAGVKDAFVIAYYQGKRISVAEAQEIEKQGPSVFITDPNMNRLPSVGGASSAPVNTTVPVNEPAPATNTPTPANNTPVENNTAAATSLQSTLEQNNAQPVEPGVVYKVQIGAFKDEVPLAIANRFIQIASKGIKNYKDPNGLTVYTLGSFKTYNEAAALKGEVVGTVPDAFVVAYNNGKKISVEEAKTLQGQ